MSHIYNLRKLDALGLNYPLDPKFAYDRRILREILEQQLLTESILDSVAKAAGDLKDKVVIKIDELKDFAAVMYGVIKSGISDKFANNVLHRTFGKPGNRPDLGKWIEEKMAATGKKLSDVIKKILEISNDTVRMFAAIGIATAATFIYEKFANKNPKEIAQLFGQFISDEAVKSLISAATAGFGEVVSWLSKIGSIINYVKKAISNTIADFKDYLQNYQGKEKSNANLNLAKENIDQLHEGEYCPQCLAEYIVAHANLIAEAEYQGRKVPLGKPMAGDVKKFKVYVKNKKGNVVKVNFGQKGVKIKKNNPGRRKNFRARHRCDTAKDRTTARYWSCRKW